MDRELHYHRPSSPSLSVSSTSSSGSETKRRSGSWRSSIGDSPTLKEAKLLWVNRKLRHIWDVDFMNDGKIVVIAGRDVKVEGQIITIVSREIYCLNLMGEEKSNPFPNNFKDPGGINVCRATGALAITDRSSQDSYGAVTILKHVGDKWAFKAHPTQNPALRVALTDRDVAICAVRWEKLVKYTAGQKTWSKSISSSNDLVPYVTMDSSGRIIVSTPANNRVSVFNEDGQILTVFPSWFIKKPTGVCVDSEDRVLVADKSQGTVYHFTPQGHFIQKVLTMKGEPRCISLYNDRYLAVGTNVDGLFLYELEWE